MEASLAYSAKKPIMSDADYDDLKKKLRKQNSRVVQQARFCSHAGRLMVLDRKVCERTFHYACTCSTSMCITLENCAVRVMLHVPLWRSLPSRWPSLIHLKHVG